MKFFRNKRSWPRLFNMAVLCGAALSVASPFLFLSGQQSSGNLDPSFGVGSGPNDGVSCLAVQPDGKILVGGTFTEVNGAARRRLARFKRDGRLDSTFDPGPGPVSVVSTMVLQ